MGWKGIKPQRRRDAERFIFFVGGLVGGLEKF
jgi:hypothetical protein